MADQLGLLPTSLVAGESIYVTVTGLSVTGYSLAYQFSAPNGTSATVSCTANGTTSWILNVPPATTLAFKFGAIRFAAMLTETATGKVECVDYGAISLAASPVATSQYSTALAAIETAIATYATNPNKRLQLGSMSIEYRSLDELIALRGYYKGLVNAELGSGPATGGPYRIFTRFQ